MTDMTSTPVRKRTYDELVGEFVRLHLWRRKMSNAQLAKLLDTSENTVGRKLRGIGSWSPWEIARLAQVLEINYESLLPRIDSKVLLPHLDSNQKPFDLGFLRAAKRHARRREIGYNMPTICARASDAA